MTARCACTRKGSGASAVAGQVIDHQSMGPQFGLTIKWLETGGFARCVIIAFRLPIAEPGRNPPMHQNPHKFAAAYIVDLTRHLFESLRMRHRNSCVEILL